MAGDRGRDLTFSILSDTAKLDLAGPAQDLDDLGRAAGEAGRDLERLDDVVQGSKVERLGDDAKATARKVDDAFDAIARSSRKGARKVDDDTDTMRRSFGDVRDEAADTGREMAASFSGSSDDIFDAFQELGANAGTAFGPVGIAAGVAAAAGVGLIRAEQEKLREMTSDLVQEMIEAGGQLTEAAITSRINTMAAEDPKGLTKYNAAALEAGITIRDLTRARAGDGEAAARVIEKLDELDKAQRDEAKAAGGAIAQRTRSSEALAGLRAELGLTAEATEAAEAAVATATTASSSTVQTAATETGAAWDDLRANLGKPIKARVVADRPSPSEIAAVVGYIKSRIGTIVVPLKPGQTKWTNTASNDRYRD